MRGTLLATALLATVAAAAQPSVKARLDSAAMLLGDPNRLVVTVEGAAATGVGWQVLDTVEALAILGEAATGTDAAGAQTFALPFSVYDSVGLLLPALPVYLPGDTLYTNDVALLVDFPPGDSTLNDYRTIREEPASLSDYLPYLIGAAAALALLAGAFYFFYFARERARPAAPPPPPEPPHLLALRALDALRGRADLDDKAYYSALDRILRAYLEGRYGVPALERTSGEVLGLLRGRNLPEATELGELLGQVDLVKFARAELPRERRATATDRVAAFVRTTQPLTPPPSSAPEADRAA